MFPWKNQHVSTTPIRQDNQRTRTTEIQNPEETTNDPAVNQPLQIDTTPFQTLLALGIATALATNEATRNASSGHSANLSSNPSPDQNNPQTCSYENLLACEPINFHGTEGVVGLSSWIEKMEAVFRVSSCSGNWQVIYATSTLMNSALAWWVNHATAVGFDVAYAIDWEALQQMMIEEYCPRQEIQALEKELWSLTMKGSEVTAYTFRFSKLANLCPGMVNPESKKTGRYIRGLASPVQGLVTTCRPTTFDSAKQLAYQWTEQCIRQGTMAPQTEKKQKGSTKRKSDSKSEENSKRHKPEPEPLTVCAVITNTPTPSQPYWGKLPRCDQCRRHHYGDCLACSNCNLKGHTLKFCRRTTS